MYAVRARLVYVDGDAVEIRISAVHCGKIKRRPLRSPRGCRGRYRADRGEGTGLTGRPIYNAGLRLLLSGGGLKAISDVVDSRFRRVLRTRQTDTH